ncbi:MAG: DUF5719 family protein [Kineosporiaceae bacterium]
MRARLRGALVLVLAGGAAVGLTLAAQAYGTPMPTTVRPATLSLSSATPTLVCPGPETLLAPAGGSTAAPGGPVTVSAVALTGAGGTATLTGLAPLVLSGDLAQARLPRATAGAVRLDARAAGAGGAVPAAALQTTLSPSGDLRGLSATGCAAATNHAWLVGGGTGAGDRTRLVLTNPTPSTALLDVFVHGPQGLVKAPAGEGVVVAAQHQAVLFVDALAPDAGQLAVEVVVRTGRVVATLHHQRLAGFTPGGVDGVVPAAPAARSQVIPGLDLAAPGRTVVRVVAPGSAEAVVRVHLVGASGPVTVPGAVVTVPGGGVRDVPLQVSTALPAGHYTAVVEADLPVVAGALLTRTLPGGELAGTAAAVGKAVPPSDLAWAGATSPVRGTVILAMPPAGIGSRLVLASPDASPASSTAAQGSAAEVGVSELTAAGVAGPERIVSVESGHQVDVAVAATTTALVLRSIPSAGSGPIHAAMVLTAADAAGPLISVVPVRPGPTAPATPPVVVHDPGVGVN